MERTEIKAEVVAAVSGALTRLTSSGTGDAVAESRLAVEGVFAERGLVGTVECKGGAYEPGVAILFVTVEVPVAADRMTTAFILTEHEFEHLPNYPER